MNFKKTKKLLAVALTISTIINSIPMVYANEEDTTKLTQDIIEEVTGTIDVVSDTFQTDDYIAVADLENTIVQIPENGSDVIVLEPAYNDEETFSMHLPIEAQNADAQINENGTVIYENEDSSSIIGVQATSDENGFEGVRSLITINDATASKEYTFSFDLEKGTKLQLAKEILGEEFDTGEVYIINANDEVIGIMDAPWAYDADGNEVPTYYKIIDGNQLVQVVEFTEDNVFPIVADPSLWKITVCVTVIAGLITATYFGATTALKVAKAIKELGGLRKAVLLIGALHTLEKKAYLKTAWKIFSTNVLGINAVHKACY